MFETRGGSGTGHVPALGFEPKTGWRMVGSGMFQTTLKLVEAEGAGHSIPVIGKVLADVDGLEVSDMTLDCNLGGQPASTPTNYARIAVAGVQAGGRDILIRRVRVINWGTQTRPTVDYANRFASENSQECFPIFVGTENAVIEDCIVELPSRVVGVPKPILGLGTSWKF